MDVGHRNAVEYNCGAGSLGTEQFGTSDIETKKVQENICLGIRMLTAESAGEKG